MYQGKFSSNDKAPVRGCKSKRRARRHLSPVLMLFSLLLCVVVTVGGTLAYLTADTTPIENTFTPGQVSCSVSDKVANNVKTSITVTNTSNVPAYIRVELVTYRVNEEGQHIGGTVAEINPVNYNTDDWVYQNGFYYTRKPVAAGQNAPELLAGGIELHTYADADGGMQVIEVMAEAIQSEPIDVVSTYWGYTPGN